MAAFTAVLACSINGLIDGSSLAAFLGFSCPVLFFPIGDLLLDPLIWVVIDSTCSSSALTSRPRFS